MALMKLSPGRGAALSTSLSVSGRFVAWAGRVGLVGKLALTLSIATAISSAVTVAVLRGIPPFGRQPAMDQLFLLIDILLILPLSVLVTWRVVQATLERRRGHAGARLHVRLVVLFSLVAVIPTLIVAVFSYILFSYGIQAWFSERVRTAIQESLTVAEAYLHEHQQTIRADVVSMASDLNRDADFLGINPERLNQVVAAQAALRSLTEAVVFDERGKILARAGFSLALQLEPFPEAALAQARRGDVAILTSDHDDRVRALVRLDRFGEVYLYVGRFVDPGVLNHIAATQRTVAQYEKLEGKRSDTQIAFSVLFLAMGVLLLSGAVWVGLSFATRMARPIASLIAAAEQVRGGDLTVRVREGESDEEFGSLSRAFNRMTLRLQTQQNDLIDANRQLDERRRFTETVLSGVSAGVIGLDEQGCVNLPNRSASLLLDIELEHFVGTALSELVPEMAPLLEAAVRRPERPAQAQIKIARRGRGMTLQVHIATLRDRGEFAALRDRGEIGGFIVTFDDITELLSAQRKAAWSDIARRIAHEIKNPLTPIQLSAERLKRKYSGEIKNDPETFATCTDTIIRHVGDIGRMVDEFSSFARLPAPIIRDENLVDLVRQAAFLQRTASPEIQFTMRVPPHPVILPCDARQVSQALINLLKNAVEAIEGRGDQLTPGEVAIRLTRDEGQVELSIEDNGRGLPREGRERLTEPYVTTRAKGTGLGLAIVKKIMEDHRGELLLEDREGGGARVRLRFPLRAGTLKAELEAGIHGA
ncbi:MAG TPA: PAS domain-containing sensor histidine kinase [Stellaceae bacterium]|nr:PAS domain-containing sensor histidine kinase [Stellaceae bacterium]